MFMKIPRNDEPYIYIQKEQFLKTNKYYLPPLQKKQFENLLIYMCK